MHTTVLGEVPTPIPTVTIHPHLSRYCLVCFGLITLNPTRHLGLQDFDPLSFNPKGASKNKILNWPLLEVLR
uniref:Putative ovule protein n=1 Tax=Solanum chacoense TaxID=4108 RepID=A0A0V0GRQ4_SOLCH